QSLDAVALCYNERPVWRYPVFGQGSSLSRVKASKVMLKSGMVDPARREIIAHARTIVVKVGTNVLTSPDGALDPRRLQSLADQVQRIRQTGRKVALDSSGAIGAGIGRLGLSKRPTDLRHLQACAAVGQSFLMRAYEECIAAQGARTAQILLTAGDF